MSRVNDSALPPSEMEELRSLVVTLRAENERLRAELAAARRDDRETPPHYL